MTDDQEMRKLILVTKQIKRTQTNQNKQENRENEERRMIDKYD